MSAFDAHDIEAIGAMQWPGRASLKSRSLKELPAVELRLHRNGINMNIHSVLIIMARKPANLEPGKIRETVLAAALHLFAVRGYFNTSVPDIASAAQVSVGSIYHHFKDKEDVARALYGGLMAGLQSELDAIAERHDNARDRCRAVMAMLFDLTEGNREAMEFMIHAKHREFLPDEPPVCSSRPFMTMRKFVEAGMRRGEVRQIDPTVATSALFGGAIRLITARLDGALVVPLPGLLDTVWECGWRGIAA